MNNAQRPLMISGHDANILLTCHNSSVTVSQCHDTKPWHCYACTEYAMQQYYSEIVTFIKWLCNDVPQYHSVTAPRYKTVKLLYMHRLRNVTLSRRNRDIHIKIMQWRVITAQCNGVTVTCDYVWQINYPDLNVRSTSYRQPPWASLIMP